MSEKHTVVGKDRKKVRNEQDDKRTIFIGNLARDTKKEDLLKLFKAYGKIETIRFRNIVPEDITKPKKFAFITKQTHPNKQTVNAFVRFKEEGSAQKAAQETNGHEFKSLHLRVDVASKSKEYDNKKSIFIGNLPFDIEDEDIYKHFVDCGQIESVRVIRDNKTGIGKGFGYVQFKSGDAIQLALKLNGSELNGRDVRISRCAKKQKTNKTYEATTKKATLNNKKAKSTKKFKKDFNEKSSGFNNKNKKKSQLKFKQFKKKPRHISTNKKESNNLRF